MNEASPQGLLEAVATADPAAFLIGVLECF